MSTVTECCICFEEIGSKNNCTTPCGHQFCFVCMSKSLANNNTCPCCRAVLMEVPDEDEDSDYSDSDSDEEEEEEDFDFPEDANLDRITEKFMAKGYGPTDLMVMLVGRIKERNDKYNPETIKKMYTDLNEIVDDLEKQKDELKLFGAEDIRIA
uniref:RING-type domain-containing protein n=1 Tax=viral metagenome TaxID=1070528 RepID=A0A6C0B444_9ZZZZ